MAHSLCRSLESAFDEAQFTGFLCLSGLNLTRFPDCHCKYDLTDTVAINLSQNRLKTLDELIYEFAFLESLNLAHNQLNELSRGLQWLDRLTFLDISGNKLRNFPSVVSFLPLEVLLLSHNYIEAIPAEIAHLKDSLTELDLSSNPLVTVPSELAELSKLRVLKLRKCRLTQLPADLFSLPNLREMDVSANHISHLPKVENIRVLVGRLIHLNVSSNPLVSPAIKTCRFGAVHILTKLYQSGRKSVAVGKRQDSDATPEAEMLTFRQDSRDSGFMEAEINSFKPKKSLITNGHFDATPLLSSPTLTQRNLQQKSEIYSNCQSPLVNEILTSVRKLEEKIELKMTQIPTVCEPLKLELNAQFNEIKVVCQQQTVSDSVDNCSNADSRVSPAVIMTESQTVCSGQSSVATSIVSPVTLSTAAVLVGSDSAESGLGWVFVVFAIFWAFLSLLIVLFARAT